MISRGSASSAVMVFGARISDEMPVRMVRFFSASVSSLVSNGTGWAGLPAFCIVPLFRSAANGGHVIVIRTTVTCYM